MGLLELVDLCHLDAGIGQLVHGLSLQVVRDSDETGGTKGVRGKGGRKYTERGAPLQGGNIISARSKALHDCQGSSKDVLIVPM